MEANNEHQKKILLMKFGVAAIAVLVFSFWFFNFQNVWKNNKLESLNNKDNALEELKKELSNSVVNMENRLDRLEEKKGELNNDVDKLFEGIMEETEKMSSSTIATSSLEQEGALPDDSKIIPGEKLSENCPLYIDCMPSIDENKICQIPVGCEGITQIAY